MFKTFNTWLKITYLCPGLLLEASIAFCASDPLVASVEMRFENQQPRYSSGFVVERNDRYFLVMCHHSFHEYENWVPKEMVITPIFPTQSAQPIEIRDLRRFNQINRKMTYLQIHREQPVQAVLIACTLLITGGLNFVLLRVFVNLMV